MRLNVNTVTLAGVNGSYREPAPEHATGGTARRPKVREHESASGCEKVAATGVKEEWPLEGPSAFSRLRAVRQPRIDRL